MARAFLSHSSEDKELVRKIAKHLGNNNCILDEFSFEPGNKTLDEIVAGLDVSDIFVLFVSDKSLESPWVKKEISLAQIGLSEEKIDRILPIIIDPKVKFSDKRIPQWMRKRYNLRYIPNEVIIYHKIRKAMSEVNFKRSRYNQELENSFVGRNEEMSRFEQDINNLEAWMPTYIIAYNFYNGIGRTTFLKNALLKAQLIRTVTSPIMIPLDGKESIESFIYKLNTISEDEAVFKADLSKLALEDKIEIAISLVRQFVANKILIFIYDNGGIVLPNKQIVPWFSEIVKREEFKNSLVFCVVSKYRPDEPRLLKEHLSLVYSIPELKPSETQSLFLKLLKIYGHSNISVDDKKLFLEKLKGIPAQIIYAVDMIDINLNEAKRGIRDIEEFSDQSSRILLGKIKENELTYQISILLSKNEIFSMTLINRIFGNNEETQAAIQQLYDLSLIRYMFDGYEYLSLNSSLADYINRSRVPLEGKYKNRVSQVTKKLLREDLDKVLINDYSGFMLTLQNMLEEERPIPSKYFMPSLIIKNVIKLYNEGDKYDLVIRICENLLKETNYDEQILWETRYWQTAAMANNKDRRALENVQYFKKNTIAYNFLKGFYYRNVNMKQQALDCYYRVLKIDSNHPRAKREIVNILLSDMKYDEAYEMAKENYEKDKTNIYHIQSYFISLIRRSEYLSPDDIRVLNNLIKGVENSVDSKGSDIARCMKGEYAFYVERNLEAAKNILLEASKINENKTYPQKTLREIYKSAKRMHDFNSLGISISDPGYQFDDFI